VNSLELQAVSFSLNSWSEFSRNTGCLKNLRIRAEVENTPMCFSFATQLDKLETLEGSFDFSHPTLSLLALSVAQNRS
jgi:hypothetical protein